MSEARVGLSLGDGKCRWAQGIVGGVVVEAAVPTPDLRLGSQLGRVGPSEQAPSRP